MRQSRGWSHGDCRVRSPRPNLAPRRPGPLLPVRHQRPALRSGVGPHAPFTVRRYRPGREHGPRVVHGRTRGGQFLDRQVYRSSAGACSRRVRGSRGWDWSERPPIPGGPPGADASLRLVAPNPVFLVLALQPRALPPRLQSSLRAHGPDGRDLAGADPLSGAELRPAGMECRRPLRAQHRRRGARLFHGRLRADWVCRVVPDGVDRGGVEFRDCPRGVGRTALDRRAKHSGSAVELAGRYGSRGRWPRRQDRSPRPVVVRADRVCGTVL